MKQYFILPRMVTIQNQPTKQKDSNKCWQRCRETGPLIHGWWNVCAQVLLYVQLFVAPRTEALQAPSVHGIFQARILEWVAISYSEDLPNTGIEPRSPVW